MYSQGAECEEVSWENWAWNPALTVVRRTFLPWGGFLVENSAFPWSCSIPKAFFLSPTMLRAVPGVSVAAPHLHVFPSLFQCYLACHKKCLETLAIQCGHKKLQGKLQLFGQDFTKASQGSLDGIPFIVKKCISEIEKRALKTKVSHTPLSSSSAG